MQGALPTKTHSYNVYFGENQDKFLGTTSIDLPDMDALTETLSGAGILGEIDEPLVGMFGSTEIEIPFRVVDTQMFRQAKMKQSVHLTLRISTQGIDRTDLQTDFIPTRIVIKGKNKGLALGSVEQGKEGNPSLKTEILYLLVEVDKMRVLELDKLNYVYSVRGDDQLKKVRAQI